jgi:hypothetical protein
MSGDQSLLSRRSDLKCMAYSEVGTLFALSGGVLDSSAHGRNDRRSIDPID